MTTYTSQGTVSFSARSTGAGSTALSINFVPHGDSMVKHDGKSYAVFLPDDGNESIIRPCKNKDGKSIDISINSGLKIRSNECLKQSQLEEVFIWVGAISAAMTHSKVEVVVNADLKLTGITVPAK